MRLALDHGGELRIEALRSELLRIAIARPGAFDEMPTPAVCADLPEPPPIDLAVEPAACRLRTAAAEVQVRFEPFALHIGRRDGSTVLRSAAAPDGPSNTYGSLNDAFVVRRERNAGDVVLGLGEKAGRLDRNGRRFLLWNTDVLAMDDAEVVRHWPFDRSDLEPPTAVTFDPYYVSIPFYCRLDAVDGKASGHFIDNSHPAYFDFDGEGFTQLQFAGGAYTEYVFTGPSLREILAGFTWLTGRLPPPPLWSLGHHQCRWKAYDEESLTALADSYRRKRIPCDGLWLDIDHMDGFRVFTWNGDRFASPHKMIAALEDKGFRLVTIVDPGIKAEPGEPLFEAARDGDHLCLTAGGEIYIGQVWPGRTAFPDFTRAATRAWWAGLVRDWARDGVAGAWIDMNEPSTGRIDSAAMRFDHGHELHARHHNLYALRMAEATADGLRQARPHERPFVLSRAGSPGIQRFAANWLGDNCARWDHLWMSMPMTMGLALSGQPFVGADVGGFAGAADGELLARWAQLGALSPFFRNHNCDAVDQYPWSFGRRWEEIYRQAVRLRYRLMPYLYTAFIQASETGAPVQRPLVFDFQSDRRTWSLDDQYLLGEHLLVAPVYRPSATTRDLYLPAGVWYDWHSGQSLDGPALHRVDAPPERIPLFVRAGAVIPLWPEPPRTTMDYRPESLDLAVYLPRRDGETISLLDEDDGLTLARQAGAFRRTRFSLRRSGPSLTLTVSASGNGFAGENRHRFRIAFHGAAIDRVTIGGEERAVVNGSVDVADRHHHMQVCATLPTAQS